MADAGPNGFQRPKKNTNNKKGNKQGQKRQRELKTLKSLVTNLKRHYSDRDQVKMNKVTNEQNELRWEETNELTAEFR